MLASGICGTDKHTFRGETQQYAGTDHASSTPFPIIQGHENVGVVAAIGDGGATAFDGIAAARSATASCPRPNRACGECEFCRGDFPYYFCRRLENYGNSLTCAEPPHLFGGWAEYLYLRPGTPVFKVPEALPTERGRADRAVRRDPQPRSGREDAAAGRVPGGRHGGGRRRRAGGDRPCRQGAVYGCVGGDRHRSVRPRVAIGRRAGRDRHAGGQRRRPVGRRVRARPRPADAASTSWSTPPAIRPASARRSTLLRDGGTLVEVGAFVDLGTVPVNPATILGRNLTIVGVAGEDARAYDSTLAMLAEHHSGAVPARGHAHVPARAVERRCRPRSAPTRR